MASPASAVTKASLSGILLRAYRSAWLSKRLERALESGPKRKADRAPISMAKKGNKDRLARVDERKEGNTAFMIRFRQKKTTSCWSVPRTMCFQI